MYPWKNTNKELNPNPKPDESKQPLSLTKDLEYPATENSFFSYLNPLPIISEPVEWLQMLSSKLHSTFVLGVVLVYGLSQGFGSSFFKVVSDYYWKDAQKKVQPSEVQLFVGLYYIPWVMKPIWGLLTDVFPLNGYKRRPYFVIAGVLGTFSALFVALCGKLSVGLALSFLIGVTAAMAIADVTIDACIARKSIEIRSLAPDIQSLCGFCSSAGALFGYSTSGFFVHHLGPQGALGLLAVPPAAMVVLGFVIHELRTNEDLHSGKKKAVESLRVAMKDMYKTIQCPDVWKPSLYMYLSLALSISTHEGQFYWYTDPKAGPAFSQEFVGIIYAIGAMASMVGVLIYHKLLKDYPFRNLLLLAQLIYSLSGMLDLVFVLRWNISLGIPDYFFVIMEECISRVVGKIRWMPMIVLSSRLCPLGIEGTFFALLMCIDSLGALTSKWGGGMILHLLHVTRTNFKNLWVTLLIRNFLRFATLTLIFLVPNVDHKSLVVVGGSDLVCTKNKDSSCSPTVDDEESIQLVPLNEKR